MAVIAHFDEGFELGQRVADLRHGLAEFRAEDDRLRIRIVENVAHLVGLVAVVDVHMREAGTQARADRLGIFRAVAQVKRDLVAGPGAARDEGACQIVHAPVGVAPIDGVVAVNERRGLRFDRAADDVQQIPVIPLHVFRPMIMCAVAPVVAGPPLSRHPAGFAIALELPLGTVRRGLTPGPANSKTVETARGQRPPASWTAGLDEKTC